MGGTRPTAAKGEREFTLRETSSLEHRPPPIMRTATQYALVLRVAETWEVCAVSTRRDAIVAEAIMLRIESLPNTDGSPFPKIEDEDWGKPTNPCSIEK